jgi:hypothetical protein
MAPPDQAFENREIMAAPLRRHPAWTAQAPSAEKNCRNPVQAAAKTGSRPMSATYTPIWLYLGELSALSALQ